MSAEEDVFSHLLNLTSDPQRINDVFPLVQQNKIHIPRQRSPGPHPSSKIGSKVSQILPFSKTEQPKEEDDSRRNTIRTMQLLNYTFTASAHTRTSSKNEVDAGSSEGEEPLVINQEVPTTDQPEIRSSNLKRSLQSGSSFLQPDQQQQFLERTQSVTDTFSLKPTEDDELRRASFDTHLTGVVQATQLQATQGRRPGTGRKLPSTEALEAKSIQLQQRTINPFDVPQIYAPQPTGTAAGRSVNPRRSSYLLSRTPAIEAEPIISPRKQISSPLPTAQVYELGYAFSRSWNAPDQEGPNINYEKHLEQALDYTRHEKQPLNPTHRQANYSSAGNFYHHLQSTQFAPYTTMPGTTNTSQQETRPLLTSTSRSNVLSLPLFQRQARSVEEWNSSDASNAFSSSTASSRFEAFPSRLFERRTVSESTKRQLMRQATVQHLQATNELSRRCQNLWHARENLVVNSIPSERVMHQFASADYSDAQSTSFDSIDTGADRGPSPLTIHDPATNRPSFKLQRPTNADMRRQKYRSLLLQRKIASSFVDSVPSSSSRKPNFSSSDDEEGGMSDSVAGSSNIFESSIDSSEQSAAATNNRLQIALRGASRVNSAIARSSNPSQKNETRSYNFSGRDYSVDLRTDSLFKDFTRIGPSPPFNPIRSSQRYIERAPTFPSRFQSRQPPEANFSQSIASFGANIRASVFESPARQSHHYSLIRR